jgi:hypothetical protein
MRASADYLLECAVDAYLKNAAIQNAPQIARNTISVNIENRAWIGLISMDFVIVVGHRKNAMVVTIQ